MPVESAADRASMFSADEFATPAQYTAPAGEPQDCTIIFDPGRPAWFEAGIGAGGLRGKIAEQKAMINVDDIAVVVLNAVLIPGTRVGGVFVPGPDSFTVAARPRLDETGAIWHVDLQKVVAR